MADRSATLLSQVPRTYRLPHCLEGVTTDGGGEVHVDAAKLVHRFARSKSITKKRELHTREISLPIDILAVHDPRFLRM